MDWEDNLARGICRITGEALKVPVEASLNEGSLPDSKGRPGATERVAPQDAAIAITSEFGINNVWQCIEYQVTLKDVTGGNTIFSPIRTLYGGSVSEMKDWEAKVKAFLNKGKQPSGCCDVLKVYACVVHGYGIEPSSPPKILVLRTETPDEGRLRWQQQVMPRSFHGAIFGGQANHRNVTAYDVALGGGKASSDPAFYQYLCDVADWRLLEVSSTERPGLLLWHDFMDKNKEYFSNEPGWRRSLIHDNSHYYSTGNLPSNLPLVPDGIPNLIISELKRFMPKRGGNNA